MLYRIYTLFDLERYHNKIAQQALQKKIADIEGPMLCRIYTLFDLEKYHNKIAQQALQKKNSR